MFINNIIRLNASIPDRNNAQSAIIIFRFELFFFGALTI